MNPPRYPQFLIDETTLVFAFRYALGRRSTAPFHVCQELRKHWSDLADWTQDQIHREIETAIRMGDAGDDCDVETWRGILALPVKSNPDECPGCGRRAVMCLCSHDDDLSDPC